MTDNAGPSFAIPDGVLARHVDEEMVLLNLESEQYYGLDRVGADIVTRLTQEPEHHAVAALCRDYDVDDATLRTDVERLVQELVEAGLLTRLRPA
jgi:myo-inositol catabolism protein IolC